jgi:ribosomal protein L25 (general stress protein Ctc)
MRSLYCGMLLLLPGCNKPPTNTDTSTLAAKPPLARIFDAAKPQVPASMAGMCLFPTSRYSEHKDASGRISRTGERTICLPGDDVAASLQRYRSNSHVLQFEVEPATAGLIVHSVVQHPISQATFKVDFNIFPDPDRRADAVAIFGSMYIDGQRSNSKADFNVLGALIRRPDFTGVVVDASSDEATADAEYTGEGDGEVEAPYPEEFRMNNAM